MRISGIESFMRPCSELSAPIPMNSVSARSSRSASSARWPSVECMPGRTTPPRTTSSMPGRSSSAAATSSAFVMTVRRRSTSRQASSSVVVPLEIAIVWPSSTRSAAAAAMARFAASRGVGGRVPAGGGRRGGGPAVGPDQGAVVGQAPEVATDRRRRDAEVPGQHVDARPAVHRGAGRRAAPGDERSTCAGSCTSTAQIVKHACADRAESACRAHNSRARIAASCIARDGRWPFLPGTRRGLDACASRTRDVRGAGARSPPEPAPGAPPGRPGDDDLRRRWSSSSEPSSEPWRRWPPGRSSIPRSGRRQAIADGSLPGRAGLLVAVEATGFEGPRQARVSRILPGWSVEQAKRMGASAVKLLVYYHPDAANAGAQERLRGHGRGRAALRLDIPLFVEPLGYDPATGGELVGEARRACVIETARRLTRDRRHGPEGRVPVRRREPRTRRPGPMPAGSWTRRRSCHGSCCRVAWTTRPSSARSPSPAGPARRACSSGGPSGRPRPRWRRRSATRGSRARVAPDSRRSSGSSTTWARRGTPGRTRSRRRRLPPKGGTGNTDAA